MPVNAPLRIIHCLRSPIGGIFRHVVDLAIAQAEAGHVVGIICDSSTGGPFEDAIIAATGPKLPLGVIRMPMRRHLSLADIRATQALYRTIRDLSPDVLHGHGAKGGAFSRAIGMVLGLSGKRPLRIYCPHGGSLHYDPATREGAVYFRLERFLERWTDGFVFVSDYEDRTYRDKVGTPKKPVRRIYNGLRPDEFRPIEPTSGMTDLMFAGMMRDLKGPQVLIEALGILERDRGLRPTARFLGAGDDRPAYEARVAALGLGDRVSFHDPMPTRQALSQGRVLVVPSLAESMPYIVLEAGAAAIPMIASEVGGIPEILGAGSPSMVPPGDPAVLADAIARVLADPDAARARAHRLRADMSDRFSLARMAGEITGFYGDLMAPRRADQRLPLPAIEPAHRLRAEHRR
jgi:glycosyltransferase involved in cell wall biosynthesis